MGRFKRHQQKYKTKKVETKNGVISVSVSEEVPIPRSPKITNLVSELFMSLKKRNQFGNFIHSYHPIENRLYNDEWHEGRHIFTTPVPIGDVVINLSTSNNRYVRSQYYYSPLGKLRILSHILSPRHEDAVIKNGDVFRMFAADCLKEYRNLKAYPNELYFSFLFATIFVIIGIALIAWILIAGFGPKIALIYLLITLFLLVVSRGVLFFNVN